MMLCSQTTKYIPSQFQDGRPVDQIILICDVDGVIRSSTEGDTDPRIITAIKALIANHPVDAAFISGTPIAQNPHLEDWRRSNRSLETAVGSFFVKEMHDRRVTLFGALGGQRMTTPTQVESGEVYPTEVSFELGKLLLQAFLNEVIHDGNKQQKQTAQQLQPVVAALQCKPTRQQSIETAEEFRAIISEVRSTLDPGFKLINSGAFMETHTSNPPWKTERSFKWIKSQLHLPHLRISHFPEEEKQMATGLAHRNGAGFNFLMISKTNKGRTIQKHIAEKLARFPNALIVTIGDTQVDFPMHQLAHLAYHVGKEQVWKEHPLPQCFLVRDQHGRDSQHVEGTLQVLQLLNAGMGKSLLEWNALHRGSK